MKLILILLTCAQIYGVFNIHIPHQRIRRSMIIRDFSSPIAEDIDIAIGSVTNAVTDAIHDVTSWMSGGVDARLNLLTELNTIQLGLQQSTLEITEHFLNGTITTEYRPLLSKLNFFLKTHLNKLNDLITILIPTMKDLTATRAITSCLHAGQVIQATIEKIDVLSSS